MGSVAIAPVTSPDVVVLDVVGAATKQRTREVDVDDVRMLLQELRLRRQLRSED